MLASLVFLISAALAAGDPAADFVTGPAASTLGAVVHALALAPPGSEDREKLSRMACAQAQDLISAAGFVRDVDTSVEKVAGQAALVIESLPSAQRCELPDADLAFTLKVARSLNLSGESIDPSLLDLSASVRDDDEDTSKKRGQRRRRQSDENKENR